MAVGCAASLGASALVVIAMSKRCYQVYAKEYECLAQRA